MLKRYETVEDIEEFLLAGRHHGKPGRNGVEKHRLAAELSADALHWATVLADSQVSSARQVAALLVGPLWARDFFWAEEAKRLANDVDWEVREWVVSAFQVFYESHPEIGYPLFTEWAAQESVGVKRAIVVAVKGIGQSGLSNPAPLLDILSGAMIEEEEYVRRNLGPFAIGDGLLIRFPEAVLDWLSPWACHPSWAAPWQLYGRPWLADLSGDTEERVLTVFTYSYPWLYNLGMNRTLVGIREAAEFLGVTPST